MCFSSQAASPGPSTRRFSDYDEESPAVPIGGGALQVPAPGALEQIRMEIQIAVFILSGSNLFVINAIL